MTPLIYSGRCKIPNWLLDHVSITPNLAAAPSLPVAVTQHAELGDELAAPFLDMLMRPSNYELQGLLLQCLGYPAFVQMMNLQGRRH